MKINKGMTGICIGLIGSIGFSAMGANEQLRFRGVVKVASCEARAENINLGSVGLTSFSGPASSAGKKEFSISLTNCSSMNIADVSMTGNIDSDVGNYFAIQQVGDYATGVALRIRTESGDIQKPNGESTEWSKSHIDSGQLRFYADYVQTQAVIRPGQANSMAEFNIAYR